MSDIILNKISVAIVSHGQLDHVYKLIASLKRHESNSIAEIIVIENLDREFTGFSDFPDIKIYVNQNPQGFSANLNLAFTMATGNYFCIINPDVVFSMSIMESLIKLLDEKRCEILAPLVVDGEGNIQDSFRSFPTPAEIISRYLGKKQLSNVILNPDQKLYFPDWLAGLFMIMPMNIFQGLSGFSEKYRLYFEDVDFCLRGKLKGYSIAVDTTQRVIHDAQRMSRKKFKYLVWHIISAIKFFTSNDYYKYRKINRDLRR